MSDENGCDCALCRVERMRKLVKERTEKIIASADDCGCVVCALRRDLFGSLVEPAPLVEPELTNEEARKLYRDAWFQHRFATSDQQREAHEEAMTLAQGFIANGPCDPAWIEFVDTLPGFDVWAERVKARMARTAGGPRG